jgi:hypothetical protein
MKNKKHIIKKACKVCDGKGGLGDTLQYTTQELTDAVKYAGIPRVNSLGPTPLPKFDPSSAMAVKTVVQPGFTAGLGTASGALTAGLALASIYSNRKALKQLIKGIVRGSKSLVTKGPKQAGIDVIDTFSGDNQVSGSYKQALGL